MFTDQEANELVSSWEIVSEEKHVRYLREAAEEIGVKVWMGLCEEVGDRYTREEWRARYESRTNAFQYAHLYFILRKP